MKEQYDALAGALLRSRAPRRRGVSCLPVLAAVALAAVPLALPAAIPSDPNAAKAREIFERVIAFKTSEGFGQVPALANYLAGELRAAGFADADIHIVPLGETASLIVRYRGDGSGGRPIDVMAHMDVVTARPEDWERDPFKLIEENGFFYGRGVLDVKGGVTSLVATFLRLKKEHFVPTRDLIIVFTGDEETTQDTTQDLVKNHRDLVDAEYALNTDGGGGTLDEKTGAPRSYNLQTAEKAYADFELTTHNPGGHSSLPRADNAIYDLADALEQLRGYAFPVMSTDTTRRYFEIIGPTVGGALGEAMARFAQDPTDAAAAAALAQNPSYVGMTRTTCVATMLRGGHAQNALPQSATANVNCRIFPGVPIDSVHDTLQQLAGPAVTVTTMGHPTSSPASVLRPDVVAAVTRAVHERHPGIPIVPIQESGASDGLYFRAAGIPTYGVAEFFIKDSDVFAHGLNERLPVKSFYDGLEYWHSLLTQLAGH
jgi:acetylornithine deacetylase/succinyl-diaminopimelate desuccinylase-like protein